MSLKDRVLSGWNAFRGRNPTPKGQNVTLFSAGYRPDQVHLSRGVEKSMVNAILNRISVDVAALSIEHVNLDDRGRYKEPRKSYFNECLTIAANRDQTARAFIRDAVMSLLDEGNIAIVPTRCTEDPNLTEGYDIGALRVGKVTQWFPEHVTVNLYNEDTGEREDRTYSKDMVALPENPFYETMNAPNSTYHRLVTKLRQLDNIDQQSASGKMNLILQLPYSTKSSFRQEQAKQRQEEVENELTTSKYGIAYIDANEKVIQLNRAIENNIFTQVEYYTNLLFAELGMPMSVFDGTADEATMLNYQNRIIEPIASAIVDAMKWKFLSSTARTQGQTVMIFKDPFKLAPVNDIANNADKFIRNEILTKNEFRQIIGFKPSNDPEADKLSNPNMPAKDQDTMNNPVVREEDTRSKKLSDLKSRRSKKSS